MRLRAWARTSPWTELPPTPPTNTCLEPLPCLALQKTSAIAAQMCTWRTRCHPHRPPLPGQRHPHRAGGRREKAWGPAAKPKACPPLAGTGLSADACAFRRSSAGSARPHAAAASSIQAPSSSRCAVLRRTALRRCASRPLALAAAAGALQLQGQSGKERQPGLAHVGTASTAPASWQAAGGAACPFQD